MSEGSGTPGAPPAPGSKAPPGGKRAAVGLQLKLPCATLEDVKARYGEELKANRFFIRTKAPRAKDTLVRLEAQLQSGTPCFRAAGVVMRVQEPPPAGAPPPAPGQEPGMALQLLAVDEAGSDLILALGGKPPPPLRSDPAARQPSSPKAAAPAPAAPAAQPSSPLPSVSEPPPGRPSSTKGRVQAAPAPAAAQPATAVPAPAFEPPEAAAAADDDPFGAGGFASAAAPEAPRAPDPPPAAKPPALPSAATRPAANPAAPAAKPPVLAPATAPRSAAPTAPAAFPAPPASSAAEGDGAGGFLRKGPIIGIDLGTTNSCAAVVQRGKPFVIPSREGYNTIPSIVAVNDKGKTIVGHPAKGQMLTNPKNTVFGAKRLIGRQFSSTTVSDLMGRFPWQIVSGIRGEAAVQLGDQQLSLQKISSMVLNEVKDIAQQYLQQPISRAVITVPAYYNDNQRQAVRQAGAMAGLFVERILNEPTAAALAFAHGRKLDQRLMVYDLGGGTFDASVLELRGNIYEVVSTGGDTFLGGTDFDKVLVDHLLEGFKEKHGIDFPGDRVALQRVTDAAERAKIALSESIQHHVRVPFVAMVGDKPYDLDQTLSRSELVLLTGHLIDRTLAVCQEVLTARGLKPADISEVLLVGGQSRMPLVRERIRSFFGREPSRAVHPDEAVAQGAALLAHSLDSPDIEGLVLVDVLPMSIGVGLPGGRFKKVVERNTSLPHKKQLSIATSKSDQRELEIAVFQGESDKAQDNEYLGTLTVPGIPPGPRGAASFQIEFSLSPECLLTVSAIDGKSGVAASATFSTQDTPEAVRKKLDLDGPSQPADGGDPEGGGAVVGFFKRLFGGRAEERGS